MKSANPTKSRGATRTLTPAEEEALQLAIAAERRLALRVLGIIYSDPQEDLSASPTVPRCRCHPLAG